MFKLTRPVSIAVCLILFLSQNSIAQSSAQEPPVDARPILQEIDGELLKVDVAAVRIFVRIKIAGMLWRQSPGNDSETAKQNALLALEEIRASKSEIPPLYLRMFQTELRSLLELNAPMLASSTLAKEAGLDYKNDADVALELLNQKNGAKLAVEKLQSSLSSGGDLSPLVVYFVHDLQLAHPSDVPAVLAQILSQGEIAGGGYSARSLFTLVHLFRPVEIESGLRIRFLNLVVASAKREIISETADKSDSYNLLSAVMPDIKLSAPMLFTEASSVLASISQRVPRETLDRRAAYDRIDRSSDPVGEMISEAENTSHKGLKNQLLFEAANLAFVKKKYRLVIDILFKLDSSASTEIDKRRDEYLLRITQSASGQEDIETTLFAYSKIVGLLARAQALKDIASLRMRSGDLAGARDSLATAVKLLEGCQPSIAKVRGLADIMAAYEKIDETAIFQVAETIVHTVNDLPELTPPSKSETEKYARYVTAVMATNVNLLPVFRSLAEKDIIQTRDAIRQISRREVRLIPYYIASVQRTTGRSSVKKPL